MAISRDISMLSPSRSQKWMFNDCKTIVEACEVEAGLCESAHIAFWGKEVN